LMPLFALSGVWRNPCLGYQSAGQEPEIWR
jgi:hypothetical protein